MADVQQTDDEADQANSNANQARQAAVDADREAARVAGESQAVHDDTADQEEGNE
jgi:hypothetical protein